MIERAGRFALTAVLTALVACGPSSGSSAGDAGPTIPETGPLPPSVGPAAIAQAICDKVDSCHCDWTKSAPCQMDSACTKDECIQTYTALYTDGLQAAGPMGLVYDPAGARACVNAVAAASCVDVEYINLCTVVFNGTESLGQPCSGTQACKTTSASPTMCGSTGTCVPDVPTPPGGPAMGAPCSGTCLDTTCEAFIGNGASGGQCQHLDGLACISGTCQPLLAQGKSCTTQFQCADPYVCAGTTCAARLADGSPCSQPIVDNPCQATSGCVSGVCTPLKANGQPCSIPNECIENNCVQGQCASLGALPICGM